MKLLLSLLFLPKHCQVNKGKVLCIIWKENTFLSKVNALKKKCQEIKNEAGKLENTLQMLVEKKRKFS